MTERPIRLDCVVRGLMPKAALGLGAVSAEKLFGGLGGKGAIEQLLELGRVLTRFDPRALRVVERDSGARQQFEEDQAYALGPSAGLSLGPSAGLSLNPSAG